MIETRAPLVERLRAHRVGKWWMPTRVPPVSQTTWWKGPVSSSMTGSEPNSCLYQGRLRPKVAHGQGHNA